MKTIKTNQDQHPNFRDKDGDLYLVRHFGCPASPELKSRENWAMAVAGGQCAWCGWKEAKEKAK